MLREKTGVTAGKEYGAGGRYDVPLLRKGCVLVVQAGIAALLVAGGLSCTPREYYQEPPGKTAGLQALDEYAWSCYASGLDYMDQSRYELARQQFSLAASSAVSKSLYEDALDAMHRAEQSIRQQR